MAHVYSRRRAFGAAKGSRKSETRGGRAFGSFGTWSPVNNIDCPVPAVPKGIAGIDIFYGDEIKRPNSVVRAWCACVFGSGSEYYLQCVGDHFTYPWTAIGKLERGWNWEWSDWLPGGKLNPTGGTNLPPGSQPVTTRPSGGVSPIAVVGGLGLLWLALKG